MIGMRLLRLYPSRLENTAWVFSARSSVRIARLSAPTSKYTTKWSAEIEFHVWSRYWTLFWPKYCARAVPVRSSRPASAHSPRPHLRRMLFTADPFSPDRPPPRGLSMLHPGPAGCSPEALLMLQYSQRALR